MVTVEGNERTIRSHDSFRWLEGMLDTLELLGSGLPMMKKERKKRKKKKEEEIMNN